MARMLQTTVQVIRRRAGVFVLVVAAIVALNLVLPPLVLSVARKPYDYFSINPWLHTLPSWLAAGGRAGADRVVERDDRAPLRRVAVSRLDRARGRRRERGRAGQAGD